MRISGLVFLPGSEPKDTSYLILIYSEAKSIALGILIMLAWWLTQHLSISTSKLKDTPTYRCCHIWTQTPHISLYGLRHPRISIKELTQIFEKWTLRWAKTVIISMSSKSRHSSLDYIFIYGHNLTYLCKVLPGFPYMGTVLPSGKHMDSRFLLYFHIWIKVPDKFPGCAYLDSSHPFPYMDTVLHIFKYIFPYMDSSPISTSTYGLKSHLYVHIWPQSHLHWV